jgi:thiosulfate/3-mercaptopyruvate sulfurtransferase
MSEALKHGGITLIDHRPDEAYLGWAQPGEARGGHLPGAVHIPWEWLLAKNGDLLSFTEMKSLWQSRGVTKESRVVTYGGDDGRSAAGYFVLRLMGLDRCASYDSGFAAWSREPDLPVESAGNYATVVSPAWVKAVQDFHATNCGSPRPPNYRNDRIVVLDASWGEIGKAKDYLQAHVPGALHCNTDLFENGYPRWMLRPVGELQRVIGSFGITPRTTVVVYGRQLVAAARVWWILNYAGVRDVRLLNGGVAAWQAAGYPVESDIQKPQAVRFNAAPRPDWMASTADVRSALDDARLCLVDVRSRDEFIGAKSGYDYALFKGRIPGSTFADNAGDESALYIDPDGTLRSYTEIGSMWERAGLRFANGRFDRDAIFYCGSGWRSSVAFLYAWLMGAENARNYSDGWIGWSTRYSPDAQATKSTPGWRQERTGNPIAAGDEPKAEAK